MSSYEKVFIRGGATVKSFERGDVVKVNINYDALVDMIREGTLTVSASGNIFFDIIKKKDPPQTEGESTHYLVFSKKVDGDGNAGALPTQNRSATPPPTAQTSYPANDDLPF